MAVPIPIIAGVAVVILIILLLIIFKILKSRKQHALNENGSKGGYQELENDDSENLNAFEEGNKIDNENTVKGKKKKREKGGQSKGKGNYTRKESPNFGGGNDQGHYVSAVFSDELPFTRRLQFSISYSRASREILLTIHRGENLGTGSAVNYEVRVTLLPSKQDRLKTKCQPSPNPVFDEQFLFKDVFPEDLENATLRARVYRLKGRQRTLVGELRADLKADLGLDTNVVHSLWRELTPADDIADDISDTQFVTDPESILAAPKENVPMLLVALQYKSVTGKLRVEIVIARHMKTLNVQKSPEVFVEISLFNANGDKISNGKTGVCKGSFHPVFEESFYFPAIEFELSGLTLVFSVYGQKFRKKELVGWFGIGCESTGEREKLHWEETIHARGEAIKGCSLGSPLRVGVVIIIILLLIIFIILRSRKQRAMGDNGSARLSST